MKTNPTNNHLPKKFSQQLKLKKKTFRIISWNVSFPCITNADGNKQQTKLREIQNESFKSEWERETSSCNDNWVHIAFALTSLNALCFSFLFFSFLSKLLINVLKEETIFLM